MANAFRGRQGMRAVGRLYCRLRRLINEKKLDRILKRGYKKKVTTGYGSPKEVYGLDPSGLKGVRLSSISELSSIDSNNQGIIIASTVGMKKKVDLIKKAQENSITILNIKDLDSYLKKIEEQIAQKKAAKLKKKEQKDSKKKKEAGKKESKLAEKLTEGT